MKIGLYGMPSAGKSFILDRIDFMEVAAGSKLLRQYDPDFDVRNSSEKEVDRKTLAKMLSRKSDFIMDGHYAFGSEKVFTEDDGNLYDAFLYLYTDPEILKTRMMSSEKNQKYAKYDIVEWQDCEINELREYCHLNNKDFYILDNPPDNFFSGVDKVIEFIRAVKNGYSCVNYAKSCVDEIIRNCHGDTITLLDGDKTITIEDSSNRVFGYTTHLYDGNFYTGYQAWNQGIEFSCYSVPELTELPVHINDSVLSHVRIDSFILTSGHEKVWKFISGQLQIPFFAGTQMCAETKFYITKFLQEADKKIIAFGDGMNDYYMLKQADIGYLIRKPDGKISRSLKNRDLEGLRIV